MACSTTPAKASIVAATRSLASRAQSRLLTPTFDISQLPSPRNRAMAGGSNGYRAALVRRRLTPGLISSSPGTAGLRPSISFLTSYPELDPAVRHPMRRIGNGGGGFRRDRIVRGQATRRCPAKSALLLDHSPEVLGRVLRLWGPGG